MFVGNLMVAEGNKRESEVYNSFVNMHPAGWSLINACGITRHRDLKRATAPRHIVLRPTEANERPRPAKSPTIIQHLPIKCFESVLFIALNLLEGKRQF
jgi:hypothetical protein